MTLKKLQKPEGLILVVTIKKEKNFHHESINIKIIRKIKKNPVLLFNFYVPLTPDQVILMRETLPDIFQDINHRVEFVDNLEVLDDGTQLKIFVLEDDEIDLVDQILNLKYAGNEYEYSTS